MTLPMSAHRIIRARAAVLVIALVCLVLNDLAAQSNPARQNDCRGGRRWCRGSGPRLSPRIRHSMGDSRGRWQGDTLVIDMTNFHPKTNYRGSRETLYILRAVRFEEARR